MKIDLGHKKASNPHINWNRQFHIRGLNNMDEILTIGYIIYGPRELYRIPRSLYSGMCGMCVCVDVKIYVQDFYIFVNISGPDLGN